RFILAVVIIVQIVIAFGLRLVFHQLKVGKGSAATQQGKHQDQKRRVQTSRFLLRFFRHLRFRSFPCAATQIGCTNRAGGIDCTGFTFFRAVTGGGLLLGGLAGFHQRHQVGLVNLIQKVDRSFLVLICPVNEDIEIIACLSGDGDELLIAAVIVHQGGVALRRKGRRILFRLLHNHVVIVSGILSLRCLCIGGNRKAAHNQQGGAKCGHCSENILMLHGRYPPVLRNQQKQRLCREPCRWTT